MKFTNEEKLDAVLIYGECGRNAKQAAEIYAKRYPNRKRLSRKTLVRICRRLLSSGDWNSKTRERTKPATGEDKAVDVMACVAANCHVGSREIARDSGISQRSVLRILHRYKFHPYHVSLHQQLHEGDYEQRVQFCRFILMSLRDDKRFVNRILFTDEATFTNHAQVNLRNMHYWATENPKWIRQVENQRQWSVNVWCGIIDNFIIGPYFIEGKMTGQVYSKFLKETLPTLLHEVPLELRLGMWYQHDGCPAHSAEVSRAVLNETFAGRWIGRGGAVKWPPRSPDLTPLDFFLWGNLKNTVYANIPSTPEDMKRRITEACGKITQETFQSVRRSLERRLQMCIAVDGKHIEHMT